MEEEPCLSRPQKGGEVPPPAHSPIRYPSTGGQSPIGLMRGGHSLRGCRHKSGRRRSRNERRCPTRSGRRLCPKGCRSHRCRRHHRHHSGHHHRSRSSHRHRHRRCGPSRCHRLRCCWQSRHRLRCCWQSRHRLRCCRNHIPSGRRQRRRRRRCPWFAWTMSAGRSRAVRQLQRIASSTRESLRHRSCRWLWSGSRNIAKACRCRSAIGSGA